MKWLTLALWPGDDPSNQCEDELQLQVLESYSLCETKLDQEVRNYAKENCTVKHQETSGGDPREQGEIGLHVAKPGMEGEADLGRDGTLKKEGGLQITSEDGGSNKDFHEELFVDVENYIEENCTVEHQETSGGDHKEQGESGLHVAKAGLAGRKADLGGDGTFEKEGDYQAVVAYNLVECYYGHREVDVLIDKEAPVNVFLRSPPGKQGEDGLHVAQTGLEGQKADLDRDATLMKEGGPKTDDDDGLNKEIDEELFVDDEELFVDVESYEEENCNAEHQETSVSLITRYDFDRRWSGGREDRSGRSRGRPGPKSRRHIEERERLSSRHQGGHQTAEDDGSIPDLTKSFVDVDNNAEKNCSAEHQETSGGDPKEQGADGLRVAMAGLAGRTADLGRDGTLRREGDYLAAVAYNLVEYYHGRREVEVLIDKAAPVNVSLRSHTGVLPWTNVSLEFGPTTSGSLHQAEDDPPPKPKSKENKTFLKAPRMRMLFKCNACSKTFSHQGNLELHARTH